MATTEEAGSPAGTWAARVARPSGTDAQTFHFTADGQVFLADGGTGTWSVTGPGAFAYRIREGVFDEAGACVAWVAVDQRARLDGDTFTSSGTSRVRASDGTPLRTAEVSVTAVRVRP